VGRGDRNFGTLVAGATGVWGDKDGPEEMLWTEEIHVDDLELIKKEWWLLGYWVKEVHPGYFEVHKEPANPSWGVVRVAAYGKPWNSKTWKLDYPQEEPHNVTRDTGR
jgi:hypothetical protein